MFPTGRKFGQRSRSSNGMPSLLEQVVRAGPSENPFSRVPVGGSFSDAGLLSNQITHNDRVIKEDFHEKDIHVGSEIKSIVQEIENKRNDGEQDSMVVTLQNLTTSSPSLKALSSDRRGQLHTLDSEGPSFVRKTSE
eukprot:TRINITY_DN209_c0_g1_i1.p2 TRINITY_DN209_c0_g1~~TRINITY_DN209_c0_g1_i1.p2  ORF type:complete len:137 (-),score=18.12 TRINITY_DN209_c0_g1_i1:371-781(-)